MIKWCYHCGTKTW